MNITHTMDDSDAASDTSADDAPERKRARIIVYDAESGAGKELKGPRMPLDSAVRTAAYMRLRWLAWYACTLSLEAMPPPRGLDAHWALDDAGVIVCRMRCVGECGRMLERTTLHFTAMRMDLDRQHPGQEGLMNFPTNPCRFCYGQLVRRRRATSKLAYIINLMGPYKRHHRALTAELRARVKLETGEELGPRRETDIGVVAFYDLLHSRETCRLTGIPYSALKYDTTSVWSPGINEIVPTSKIKHPGVVSHDIGNIEIVFAFANVAEHGRGSPLWRPKYEYNINPQPRLLYTREEWEEDWPKSPEAAGVRGHGSWTAPDYNHKMARYREDCKAALVHCCIERSIKNNLKADRQDRGWPKDKPSPLNCHMIMDKYFAQNGACDVSHAPTPPRHMSQDRLDNAEQHILSNIHLVDNIFQTGSGVIITRRFFLYITLHKQVDTPVTAEARDRLQGELDKLIAAAAVN